MSNTSTPTGLLDAIRERRNHQRLRKPGAVPGSLIYEGPRRTEEATISVIEYSADDLKRTNPATISECSQFSNSPNATWLHFTGLHDIESIAGAGKIFGIPNLTLEDILNPASRAKIESLEDGLFIQIKILEHAPKTGQLDIQQFSLFLSSGTLLTFTEMPTSVFDPIFKRLKNQRGRLRNRGLDYLLWALLDTVIDHALASLHILEQNLIGIDELIQEDHTAVDTADLYALKHEISSLLHIVRPNREIVHALRHSPLGLIGDDLAPYLDDLRDHTVALSDECEALREYASGIREYLLAETNQRMNNVMKVLTCISTIFLPLTFLAGVYGMNFHHMPELSIPWAYPVLWIVFLTVGLFLIVFFRKQKWL